MTRALAKPAIARAGRAFSRAKQIEAARVMRVAGSLHVATGRPHGMDAYTHAMQDLVDSLNGRRRRMAGDLFSPTARAYSQPEIQRI